MAKWIRVWEKKRGDRRTGSRLLGDLGEAMFFAVMFLLGVASLGYLIGSQVIEPTPELYSLGVGFWLLVIVLGSFVLIGGGSLIFALLRMGTSAERRSALAQRAANLDLFTKALPRERGYPTVPSDENLTNSPGVVLAFRLPSTQSPAWRLSAVLVFCVVWNVTSVGLLVIAVRLWQSGRPDWVLTVLVVPFVAIGAWATYYLLRQMLIHTGVGPTHVEVSAHPFYPGEEYEFYLTQAGRLRLNFLQMALVCEEVATFQQGTDVREEVCRVFEQVLYRGEDFSIDWGIPFERRGHLIMPPDAMHSFESGHNAVQWNLVVEGKTRAWPHFSRRFPIVVHPGQPPGERL
ncbi:MAG: hypothetical protein J5I93_12915 [Pirellulaceae bacterium]|nr:hypothetical protein [Pirellulaceae bacterium]